MLDDDGGTGFGSFDVYEPDAFNLVGTIQQLASPNANNAGIDLTVTGGTLPYSFDWDNDGIGDNDDPEDLTTVGAGTYTVMVTDVNGGTATAAYLIEVLLAISCWELPWPALLVRGQVMGKSTYPFRVAQLPLFTTGTTTASETTTTKKTSITSLPETIP